MGKQRRRVMAKKMKGYNLERAKEVVSKLDPQLIVAALRQRTVDRKEIDEIKKSLKKYDLAVVNQAVDELHREGLEDEIADVRRKLDSFDLSVVQKAILQVYPGLSYTCAQPVICMHPINGCTDYVVACIRPKIEEWCVLPLKKPCWTAWISCIPSPIKPCYSCVNSVCYVGSECAPVCGCVARIPEGCNGSICTAARIGCDSCIVGGIRFAHHEGYHVAGTELEDIVNRAVTKALREAKMKGEV
jgi:hypothetical protein